MPASLCEIKPLSPISPNELKKSLRLKNGARTEPPLVHSVQTASGASCLTLWQVDQIPGPRRPNRWAPGAPWTRRRNPWSRISDRRRVASSTGRSSASRMQWFVSRSAPSSSNWRGESGPYNSYLRDHRQDESNIVIGRGAIKLQPRDRRRVGWRCRRGDRRLRAGVGRCCGSGR